MLYDPGKVSPVSPSSFLAYPPPLLGCAEQLISDWFLLPAVHPRTSALAFTVNEAL
jgi:hypothetical protein